MKLLNSYDVVRELIEEAKDLALSTTKHKTPQDDLMSRQLYLGLLNRGNILLRAMINKHEGAAHEADRCAANPSANLSAECTNAGS